MSFARGGFTFVQISDPQFGFKENHTYAEAERLLAAAVDKINSISPDFVIVTGDMVDSSCSTNQLQAYRQVLSKINPDIPVWHIPGNHDIGKDVETGTDRYISEYGYDRFAFKHKGIGFIGINSVLVKENSPRETEQYRWLCRQLKKLKECDRIFVFSHYPIILKRYDEKENYSNFPPAARERYLSLFSSFKVSAVIAGHLHNSSRCSEENIDLITTGPCGKPLGTGKSGIAVITVDKDGYIYNFMETDTF